ncbi:MAG: hypothetical protein AB1611_15920 [bacterium]
MVHLETAPTADVTVTLSGVDATEGSLSTASLTFTTDNWDQNQEITVTGVNDDVADGDITYTITATAAGGGYDGIIATMSVTNTNDDAGLIVNPTSVTTTEAGGTADFTVRLATAPTDNVTVTFVNVDATEGSLSSASLTFTTGNWNQTQTVTITGLNDDIADGSQPYTITAQASGGGYNGVTTAVSVANTDDETPGITINPPSVTTTEAGGAATFTVRLSTEPAEDITVTFSGVDTTEGSLSDASLTFTPADWSTPQTITVTGLDDTDDDGDITYPVTATAAAAGVYNGVTATLSITNTDNEVPALIVSSTGVTTTEAAGGNHTATFTVRLATQPTDEVTVALTGLDATEGSLSTASLTFTPATWSQTQDVTITGVDESVDDDDQTYTITATAAGGDYQGLTATVSVTNTDDDTKGITVDPTGVSTTEATGANHTATFTMRLASEPTADVTVALTGLDATEGSLSTASLTFTPANWSQTQEVIITGVDDNDDDGNASYTITATASGGDYTGLTATVSVTNTDDDTPAITVNPTSVTTSEAAGEDNTDTFTVRLTTVPTAEVTVNFSGVDATEGSLSATSLTFTPANWDQAQTVTVTGADDSVTDGAVAYTITATAAGGDYEGLTATVSVTNNDNETPAITINPTNVTTTEAAGAGNTATFTVQLAAEPTADVTVAFTGVDATEGSLSATSLTFTPANWDQAQTVTVTGADDSIIDGAITYTVTATASGGGYDTVTSTVSITNTDNDTPGITVSPTSGPTTSEAGAEATFNVVLNTQPTEDVTIALTSSDTTEGIISAATLTFTPDNWNIPQAVTITGVDDGIIDGPITYTIITAAAQSNDTAYNGINPADVTVINNDNDYGLLVSAISGNTTEDKGKATFTVSLSTQPTTTVTVRITSSDTTEGTVSPDSIDFSGVDWNTPKTVTVTGVNDDRDDGNIAYKITLAVTSQDVNYSGLAEKEIALINVDNDSDNGGCFINTLMRHFR